MQRGKGKVSFNRQNTIMKCFKTLGYFLFVLNQAVLDIYYKDHCVWASSRVAKQIKIKNTKKLGKIGKI